MSSHRRSTLARTDENLSDDSDLVKVELNRRLAAKDHQRDLELASLGVNLGDLAIKVGKRAIGDADGRADLNIDRGALGRIALTGDDESSCCTRRGKAERACRCRPGNR